MADQFANWKRRLAGDKTVPTYETEPDAGYYRKPITEKTPGGATKKVGWIPVAYWYADDGQLQCVIGRSIASREAAIREWLWVAKHPIAEDLYFDVTEKGLPWPDMPHEPPAQPSREPEPDTSDIPEATEEFFKNAKLVPGGTIGRVAEPGPGHNNPPEPVAPEAAMREQIENAVGASKDVVVNSKASADAAQSFRSRLLELANNADSVRVREKEPHLTAARKVDERYMPLVKMAKQAADRIRDLLNDFATEQLRLQRAAEREAERLRAEAELAAARRAQAERDREAAMAKDEPLPELPPVPQPVAPAPVAVSTIKGASGKAAAVDAVKYAVILHWGDVLLHYANEPELRAVAQKLANRDAKAGLKVPGAMIEEKANVR